MQKKKREKPLLIALGGLSGVGKTTLAFKLAEEFDNAIVIDADLERKKMHGVSPFTSLSPEAYSHEENRKFLDHLRPIQIAALAQHDAVIITGTFITRETRARTEEIAANNNADFVGLWMTVPVREIFSRLSARQKGTSFSDAGAEVLRKQLDIVTSLTEEDLSWNETRASGTPNDVLCRARMVIEHVLSRNNLPLSSLKPPRFPPCS